MSFSYKLQRLFKSQQCDSFRVPNELAYIRNSGEKFLNLRIKRQLYSIHRCCYMRHTVIPRFFSPREQKNFPRTPKSGRKGGKEKEKEEGWA